MTQIELQSRYPDSRPEDITDAYMRGFEVGLAMRTDENARLREQNRYLMKGDLLHVLTDQELAEQQRREREMQASIKALDDENAELRKELAVDEPLFEALNDANDGLLAENAKLRELVRDMWHELDAATQYDAGGGRGSVCEFAIRMRELGVEV